MTRRPLIWIFLASFLVGAHAQPIAPVSFAPAITNTTSYGTWHVDTADFNEDGNVDIIFGDYSSASHILLGNGAGGFTEITNFAGSPKRTWVADFNKDGHADFVAGQSSNAGVGIGLGNGTFIYSNYVTGGSDFQLAVGDFDSDGFPDIITPAAPYQAVLRNKGDGTFETVTNIHFGSTSDTAFPLLADFDKDNTNDLILTYVGSSFSDIYIRKGLGGGTFAPRVGYQVRMNVRSINAADFNGDNNLDLIALSEGDPINILLGDGAGGFQVTTNNRVIASIPSPPAIADFNGDGALDFAVCYYFNKALDVFLNDGTGTFSTVVTNRNVDLAQTAAAADFNNDGRPDVIGTRYSPAGYTVFLNISTPTLAVSKLTGAMELSWPDWVGYYPVAAPVPGAVEWLPLTNTVSTANARKRIELLPSEPHQFHRLKKD